MGGKVLELESDKLIEQGLEHWKTGKSNGYSRQNVASGQVYD